MNAHADYEQNGFYLAKGLFSVAETEAIRDHYTQMVETSDRFADSGVDRDSEDPLRRYPRLMQMHLGDDVAMQFLLDSRLEAVFMEILGSSPFAVQTMLYFKPAGARGQALHQDNRYLRVEPGTCTAAWMALDRCDAENGCLQVVPGSHVLPVLCPTKADTTVSFTQETVPIPEGSEVVDVIMDPGDVLFFHGNLIHGSGPNLSKDRFRRIIVGHYVVAEAEKVGYWYAPAFRFDGTVVELKPAEGGTPCGTFTPAGTVEMSDLVEEVLARH